MWITADLCQAERIIAPGARWVELLQIYDEGHLVTSDRGLSDSDAEILFDSFLSFDKEAILDARTSPGPIPLADVQGFARSTDDEIGVVGFASIRYSFVVQPKSPLIPLREVPVEVRSLGDIWLYQNSDGPNDVFDEGSASVTAQLAIDGKLLKSLRLTTRRVRGSSTRSRDFDIIAQFNELPLTAHTIDLRAHGRGFFEEGTVEFQALIDPEVYIDPEFEFKDDYTIIFNTPLAGPFADIFTVPEPSSIMLFWFAALPIARKRRALRR
jgi:hypothetical protein